MLLIFAAIKPGRFPGAKVTGDIERRTCLTSRALFIAALLAEATRPTAGETSHRVGSGCELCNGHVSDEGTVAT
jgi:hypothetical protein